MAELQGLYQNRYKEVWRTLALNFGGLLLEIFKQSQK